MVPQFLEPGSHVHSMSGQIDPSLGIDTGIDPSMERSLQQEEEDQFDDGPEDAVDQDQGDQNQGAARRCQAASMDDTLSVSAFVACNGVWCLAGMLLMCQAQTSQPRCTSCCYSSANKVQSQPAVMWATSAPVH